MASTRLYLTASVEEQWRALAKPWLSEQAAAAWRSPKSTVILTPGRAEGFYLRSRLIEENIPFLGLRFWTPSDAREFLLAELLPELGAATRAELGLIARTCAEKLISSMGPDNPTLASVVREPSAFLSAYDLLLGAGWDPARDGAVYGRDLAREMQRVLKKNRIATQSGVHQQLREAAFSRKEPLLANLLVVGFNAAHWPLWDLLKAVASCATNASIALAAPRVFGREIDQLWIGSWEQITGSEYVIPDDLNPSEPTTPFSSVTASYEQGASALANSTSADMTFLVAPGLATQTRSVVLQALDYLKNDSCTRLGIVFPDANALALGVADELRRLDVPFDDGTGFLTPGPFEQRCWQSWIALQEDPGVPRLIEWIRACDAQGVSCGIPDALSARKVADVANSALGESLVDDLAFLARYLEESSKRSSEGAVAEFLRARIALPEEATFAQFLENTRRALSLPGWEKQLERLQIDPPAWLLKNKEPLSRRAYLEWLKEATDSQTRTRGAEGNHFYGRVHLIIYAQMTGQTWSHLILTGLNEGVWPRVHEAGAFGSRHELTALNQRVRELNPRIQVQGSQGEGHVAVADNNGHCLLPLERQDLALRDLCSALDSTRVSACLAAMTTEGGRSLLPSDFFNHAYQSQTGRLLDEKAFGCLANATQQWCRKQEAIFETASPTPLFDIAATRTAHVARRDDTQPFGPYEFAYAQPPSLPIQLFCKQWEDAWNRPADVWFDKIIGASSWPDGKLSWSQAIGIWVHRWLAMALRDCRERNSTAEFPVLLWAAADRDAQTVRDCARGAGIKLYPWWDQVWSRAKTRALQLSESLAPLLPDHAFLSEFTLPGNLMVTLPGSDQADFRLKGRIDFLCIEGELSDHDPQNPNFSDTNCWVIDFKTGSSKPLTQKNILKGTGLQALLYAVAIRALGASTTSMSLLAPESEAKAQVELTAALNPILASLGKFHRDGIFGMRSNAGSGYGFAPQYPIATQFIPSYILDAKWELTHGASGEGDA